MKNFVLKIIYRLLKKNPGSMEMVQYWKNKESVEAKVTTGEHGEIVMKLEGELYTFPTFPRAHLLFGPLSKLKHEIKNQVFNQSWKLLEEGKTDQEVIKHIKTSLFGEVAQIAEKMKYDMLPTARMTPSVREIHRAWTKVAPERTYILRDYLCFILQEDDAYRFRVQWLVNYFRWFGNPIKMFDRSLAFLEHAEVIGDMKERMRLLRRVLMVALKDESIRNLCTALFKEIDWSKVKLSKADKFHFRGKYFKVDFPIFEY